MGLDLPGNGYQRPCMMTEIETWLSDSRAVSNSVVDHRSRRPVLCPLRICVDRCHVCHIERRDASCGGGYWKTSAYTGQFGWLWWFEVYCQLPLYDVEKEVQLCWALAAMRAAWLAGSPVPWCVSNGVLRHFSLQIHDQFISRTACRDRPIDKRLMTERFRSLACCLGALRFVDVLTGQRRVESRCSCYSIAKLMSWDKPIFTVTSSGVTNGGADRGSWPSAQQGSRREGTKQPRQKRCVTVYHKNWVS